MHVLTQVLEVDRQSPQGPLIAMAAEVITRGGLVAFPTETVYGLGANALNPAAVERIFEVKGRPPSNPLIVHAADLRGAQSLVSEWPPLAQVLAEEFWPGPLTLVLPRQFIVPGVVTGGGPTIGVRVPRHPVALALIHAAGVPVAAPSANLATQISPTRPAHVLAGLNGRIEMVLAAGATPGGLESTVLDLTTSVPRILRLGLVTPAELHEVIGPVQIGGMGVVERADSPARSPGLSERHYAPLARLIVAEGSGAEVVRELRRSRKRVGWICFDDAEVLHDPGCIQSPMPREPVEYAARLYATLFDLDGAGVDCIVAARPPATVEWLAIRDRLKRAAS